MTKKEARNYAKKILSSYVNPEYSLKIAYFLENFLEMKKKIISYRSHPPEFNLDFLESKYPHISFFFPKVLSKEEKNLEFIHPTSWKIGSYGILEPDGAEIIQPSQADLCILPCLGCNSKGYRLGRGGGFYDKNMKGVLKQKLIGITASELSNLNFQEEIHDLQFGAAVTPSGIIFFNES